MPLGTVHAVQIDPVNATPQAAADSRPSWCRQGVADAGAGQGKAYSSKAPIPVITYRDSDWQPGRPDRGAQGRHRPHRRAAAGAHPHLRAAAARQLRRGDRGDGQKSDGRYVAGDRAGRSGLQRAVRRDPRRGAGSRSTGGGKTRSRAGPHDGADVATTLDPRVQAAAEKALADADLEGARRPRGDRRADGQVLAAANSPTSGFDRALTGRYPPGSTFKVAMSYAYLTGGITTPTSRCRARHP